MEVTWRVLYNTNHPVHEGSNVDLIIPENAVFQPNGIENQVLVGLQIVIHSASFGSAKSTIDAI